MEKQSLHKGHKKLEDRTRTQQQCASSAGRGESKYYPTWRQERITEKRKKLLALLHSAAARQYWVFYLTATLEMTADNLQHLLEAHKCRTVAWGMDWMMQTGAKGSLNPTMFQRNPLKDAIGKLDKQKRCVHMCLSPSPLYKKFPSSSHHNLLSFFSKMVRCQEATRIVSACF